jgi:hypothetical protein
MTLPWMTEESSRSLANNASLALIRLGQYVQGRDLAIQMFNQMTVKGILSSADFALAMITEAELCLGNLESTACWIRHWEHLLEQKRSFQNRYYNGYLSSKFLAAVYSKRYGDAEQVFSNYLASGNLRSPRHLAVSRAHLVLLRYWSGQSLPPQDDIRELMMLYERGCALGAQDTCVEALWCIAVSEGRTREASQLLSDYLNVHRRERGLPEWSLRQTTSTDPAWLKSPFAFDFARAL